MTMRLFIAEKPAVAKDIANALGGRIERKENYIQCGNDVVTWCIGHIIESADPSVYNPAYGERWNKAVLPLKLFPVQYVPKESTKAQVKTVVELIKKADVIVHAGDPDDEGQLLVEEVLIFANNTKPVKRLLINDNTDAAVKKALNNLQDNRKFKGMFNRALARSVGDNIFGLTMTRAYTVDAQAKGYRGVLSVGRVQTPVLGLICQRYLDNKNHKESYYQTITGTFNHEKGKPFNANWKVSENAPQDDKKRLNNEDYAKNLTAFFKGKDARVISAGVENKETAPPLPFNLSDLQQTVNKKHKLSAKKVLDITQDLREKYKCITYNRSDCSYLSDEQFQEAPVILQALESVFKQPLDIDANRKSKAFNSENVTAHTAIIPTDNVPDLEKMTADEKNVYQIIAERYLIQFMPNKCYQEASTVLKIDNETFSCRAVKVTDKGFTLFYADEDNEEDSEEQDNAQFFVLSDLRTGETVNCTNARYKNNKTNPPPIFTEATLLNAMDNIINFVTDPHIKALLKAKDAGKKKGQKGIGTQATRANFVPLLVKRGFIELEKQKLIPTEAGLSFYRSLPAVITQPDMTALWSEKQQEIEQLNLSVETFINELYDSIDSLIKDDLSATLKIDVKANQNLLKVMCPNCNKSIVNKEKLVECETRCGFKVWKTLCEKKLTDKQIETLIEKESTGIIKGFKSKSGKSFDAKLKLDDKTTGKIKFEFENSR